MRGWSKKKYSERCLKSLKPLSDTKNKTDSEIIDQWVFNPLDKNFRVVKGEVCQLCGKPHNKYQFKIENSLNGNFLWIGSQCVKNMNFPFFNGELNTDIKGNILNSFIERYKFNENLEALSEFLKNISFDGYNKIISDLRNKKTIKEKQKKEIKKQYNIIGLGFSNEEEEFFLELPSWVIEIIKGGK